MHSFFKTKHGKRIDESGPTIILSLMKSEEKLKPTSRYGLEDLSKLINDE